MDFACECLPTISRSSKTLCIHCHYNLQQLTHLRTKEWINIKMNTKEVEYLVKLLSISDYGPQISSDDHQNS